MLAYTITLDTIAKFKPTFSEQKKNAKTKILNHKHPVTRRSKNKQPARKQRRKKGTEETLYEKFI